MADPQPVETPAAETPAVASWQKRHPTLSRLLLYGGGALVVALFVVLIRLDRRKDEEERIKGLRGELANFDILFAVDGGAARVLDVLDEKFRANQVPPAVFHSAERIRAQAHSHLGAPEQGLEVINRLDPAAVSALESEAVRLEHAEILARATRGDEALALLEGGPSEGPTALRLLWAAEQAWILASFREDEAAARDVLLRTLEGTERPLPSNEIPLRIGVREWGGAKAAHLATKNLVPLVPEEDRAFLWEGLLQLAPGDFECVASAAEGLLAAGDLKAAQRTWMRAVELNAKAARIFIRRSPSIRVLHENLKKSLNSSEEGGR